MSATIHTHPGGDPDSWMVRMDDGHLRVVFGVHAGSGGLDQALDLLIEATAGDWPRQWGKTGAPFLADGLVVRVYTWNGGGKRIRAVVGAPPEVRSRHHHFWSLVEWGREQLALNRGRR